MKKIGWLEDFLEPLEKKAKEILKTQSNIKEDSQFKKLNKGKGITRYQANSKYQSAEDLLKQTQSFRKLILKNGTPRDIIYKLTWILGIAYDMGWPVPSHYVIGRSKGGKAPKKPMGIMLAIEKAYLNSKRKTVLSLWKYIQREEDFSINGFDIEYEEDNNRLYQYDRTGKSKGITFRSFQRLVSEFKKNRDTI